MRPTAFDIGRRRGCGPAAPVAACALLSVLALAAIAPAARASSGGAYDLGWSKVASGGVSTSSGGIFTLGGTIGQADAATSSGGIYQLTGGFWAGVGMTQLVDAPAGPRLPPALSLRGFAENPTVASRLQVAFSLAGDEPAQLELLDVTGRRVSAYNVGLLGAGPHTLDLGGGATVAPGLYWIRLTQGLRAIVRKAVVLR